jgi:hypothetical protein
MIDQEIEFARGVLVVVMIFLAAYQVIWWPEISKNGKIFLGIGSFVVLIIWATIG